MRQQVICNSYNYKKYKEQQGVKKHLKKADI